MAKTTEEKVRRARTLLLLDEPFFGTLALNLGLEESKKISTAAVNGKRIRYNPDFVDSLSMEETKGLIAHEVMHCANGHPWRREHRSMGRWNMACDFAINKVLEDAGFQQPGSLNSALAQALNVGGSAERIYLQMPEVPPEDGDDEENEENEENDGDSQDKTGDSGNTNNNQNDEESDEEGENNSEDDPFGCGGVEDAPDDVSEKEMENEWKRNVAQAASVAKRGTLPDGIKEMVENIVNPGLPWDVLLRDFVERSAKDDYDWTKPSRRFAGQDIIMPGLQSDELPDMVCGLDTSYSTHHVMSELASLLSDILFQYDTKLHVIHCDAKVHKVEEFTQEDLPLKLEAVGRGGTAFEPVFEWVEKQQIVPSCLIYLTDLEGSFPEPPCYPVVWLSIGYVQKAPFGEVIDIRKLLE